MVKSNPGSFNVCINRPEGQDSVIILGVTSICPNLGGVLFFTENGHNYQLERYEKFAGHDGISYTIEYDEDCDEYPAEIVLDYRRK